MIAKARELEEQRREHDRAGHEDKLRAAMQPTKRNPLPHELLEHNRKLAVAGVIQSLTKERADEQPPPAPAASSPTPVGEVAKKLMEALKDSAPQDPEPQPKTRTLRVQERTVRLKISAVGTVLK